MKKTTKAEFNRFKREFLRWQEKLGLTQYRIDFFREKLENNYARIYVNEAGKAASVSLANEIDSDSDAVNVGPEAHAKHEALHLLTHRLKWLGDARYIESSDLDEEWEAVVRRLEKVLK